MKQVVVFLFLFLGVSVWIPTIGFAQDIPKVKPITGTWINLAYKDVRNKYTNPKGFDNTDPNLWKAKVRELAQMGIEYLVFMEVANEGEAYYPSQIMPHCYNDNIQSPVEAILDEAKKCKMKVFMSTGWAKDQDDNLQDPAIRARQLQIMEELSVLYKEHDAFYGWYLPVEDCICPIFAEHAVQAVNALIARAKELTPGKRTMISPYGIGLSDFDDPNYETQLAKLQVDIIAYQDEVGCVRDKFTLPRLKRNWKKLRDIHNRLDIEMWANCETFTWEGGTNDRQSALIPASYPRLLSQQVAASMGGVDKIISFMFGGIIENPDSPYQLGQPIWSNKLYTDYIAWKNNELYWRFLEATFVNGLLNEANPSMCSNATLQYLLDGEVAEENSEDKRWVKFTSGHHEILIDLQKEINVENILFRMLKYAPEQIGMPSKLYIYQSDNGKEYRLASIKDASRFPNDQYDAWIEGALIEKLGTCRYVKIAFEAIGSVYMDEIFINPRIE